MRIEIFKIFTQFLNYTITAVILSHPTPSKNEKIIQEVS
jgi:DNA repair protein RadC